MSDHIPGLPEDECLTCLEGGYPEGECDKSLRPCGHHCNHSWEQDCCHWCGAELVEDENGDFTLLVVPALVGAVQGEPRRD